MTEIKIAKGKNKGMVIAKIRKERIRHSEYRKFCKIAESYGYSCYKSEVYHPLESSTKNVKVHADMVGDIITF